MLPASTLVLTLLFVAGIAAAPALDRARVPGMGVLRGAYGMLCHQDPERSLTFGGAPLAVCSRCTGLYVGGLVGLATGLAGRDRGRLRPRARWVGMAVAPTALDALAHLVTGFGLSNVPRCVLAVPAGFALGLCLAVGVEDLGRIVRRT